MIKKSKFILFMILTILCSCSNQSVKTIENYDWMIGEWVRTNDSEGQQTFETWEKVSATLYKGLGCTVQGNDTILLEKIKFFKNETNWIYEVSGINLSPTPFLVEKALENEFKAVNEENEFPKWINYRFESNEIIAIVGDDANLLKFHFVKK